MPKIEVNLTLAELKKLQQLSAAKGKTVEQCIRAFALSCQPNGGGWVHPMNKRVKE